MLLAQCQPGFFVPMPVYTVYTKRLYTRYRDLRSWPRCAGVYTRLTVLLLCRSVCTGCLVCIISLDCWSLFAVGRTIGNKGNATTNVVAFSSTCSSYPSYA